MIGARDSNMLYWLLAGGILFYVLRRVSLPAITPPAWSSATNSARGVDEGGAGDPYGVIVAAPKTNSKSITSSTLNLIRRLEGLRLTPYPDAGGYSAGYGHYLGTNRGAAITQEQANAWLADDVTWAASAVVDLVEVALSQSQFDALVSFTYNLGRSRLAGSSLLRRLNMNDYTGAARQFPRWVYSQGQISPALLARRKIERELFERA